MENSQNWVCKQVKPFTSEKVLRPATASALPCNLCIDNVLIIYLCRVGIVEESAIRELKERLYANKTALMAAFLERDTENTGEKMLYHSCVKPLAAVIKKKIDKPKLYFPTYTHDHCLLVDKLIVD